MIRKVRKKIRRSRFSRLVALAVAIPCFPLFLVCVHWGMRGGFHLWRTLVDNTFQAGNSFYVLVLANVGTLALAYVASRLVYDKLRWKHVEPDGTHCCWCGYNLTGNISGVCPECGQAR